MGQVAVESLRLIVFPIGRLHPRVGRVKNNSQVASVLLTVVVHSMPGAPLGFGNSPESTPPAILTHGFANVDCVTLWLACMKTNLTVSPTAAWMDSGL